MNAPQVLLGGGIQAGHVVSLLESAGLPWAGLEVYDDAYPARGSGPRGLRIRGTLDEGLRRAGRDGAPALIALGSRQGAARYAAYARARELGVPLATLIHPSCSVAPSAVMGENVVLGAGCVVAANVRMGALGWCFSAVVLEHDGVVGPNVTFGPGAVCCGFVSIGAHAFIGAGAVLAPEVRIGARTLVGAGAVVTRDLPPDVVAYGSPARARRATVRGLDVPTRAELAERGVAEDADGGGEGG